MKLQLPKFTFKSFLYFLNLVKQVWKNHFNKILLAVMAYFFYCDLFTQKDMTGGVAFFIFVLFGYMLQIVHLKNSCSTGIDSGVSG